MSTRSLKRVKKQESTENVNETIIPSVLVENIDLRDQDVIVAEQSSAKSIRLEKSVLEVLKASLKKKTTSEIRGLLAEFQKELLKLLKPKTNENIREQNENALESESRDFIPQQDL